MKRSFVYVISLRPGYSDWCCKQMFAGAVLEKPAAIRSKIGHCQAPSRRIGQLAGEKKINSGNLRIDYQRDVRSKEIAKRLERFLHAHFASKALSDNEWFRLSEGDLNASPAVALDSEKQS
jgi:hypothetical protein